MAGRSGNFLTKMEFGFQCKMSIVSFVILFIVVFEAVASISHARIMHDENSYFLHAEKKGFYSLNCVTNCAIGVICVLVPHTDTTKKKEDESL